jgi:hypothetical protein
MPLLQQRTQGGNNGDDNRWKRWWWTAAVAAGKKRKLAAAAASVPQQKQPIINAGFQQRWQQWWAASPRNQRTTPAATKKNRGPAARDSDDEDEDDDDSSSSSSSSVVARKKDKNDKKKPRRSGGNEILYVRCPRQETTKKENCVLRISPASASQAENYALELRLTHLASRKKIAPRLLQGEVLLKPKPALVLLMERYAGDAHDAVLFPTAKKVVAVSDATARALADQVARHVEEVAKLGFFLGDIKPRNVVVRLATGAEQPQQPQKPKAKLIDFEARFMSHWQEDQAVSTEAGKLAVIYAVGMLGLLRLHARSASKSPKSSSAAKVFAKHLEACMRRYRASTVAPLLKLQKKDVDKALLHRLLADRLRHYHLQDEKYTSSGAAVSVAAFWADAVRFLEKTENSSSSSSSSGGSSSSSGDEEEEKEKAATRRGRGLASLEDQKFKETAAKLLVEGGGGGTTTTAASLPEALDMENRTRIAKWIIKTRR